MDEKKLSKPATSSIASAICPDDLRMAVSAASSKKPFVRSIKASGLFRIIQPTAFKAFLKANDFIPKG